MPSEFAVNGKSVAVEGVGRTSSGPGDPDPIRASLPHPRALVQPVTPAESRPFAAHFAPTWHTAPPPRPPRGHRFQSRITP